MCIWCKHPIKITATDDGRVTINMPSKEWFLLHKDPKAIISELLEDSPMNPFMLNAAARKYGVDNYTARDCIASMLESGDIAFTIDRKLKLNHKISSNT